MTSRLLRVFLLGMLLLAASTPASSQPPAKRPLKHADYAGWKSLQAPVLSPDGAVVAYALAPEEGDGEFVARNLPHRQGIPPPARQPAHGRRPSFHPRRPRRRPGPSRHLFSPDGKFVAFPIYSSRADKSKGKAETTSAAALGLMSLADGKVTRIDRVASYQVPEEGPAVLVYHRSPPPADRGKGGAAKTAPKAKAPTPTPDDAPLARVGAELVLRNLIDGKERTFADVTEYSLTKNGQWLVYASGTKEESSGVYAVAPGREAPPLVLRSGPGAYSRLTWDVKQSQLVFFHSRKPTAPPGAAVRPQVRICHWKPPANGPVAALAPTPAAARSLALLQTALPTAGELTPAGKPAMMPGYEITDQGGLSFSPDASRVYFGVVPPPPPAAKPTGQTEEKAVVELWHHKDDFIQPMQKVRYSATRTYRAVFHLDDRSCRQLSDEALSSVQTADAGDWRVGLDDRSYRTLVGSVEVMPPVDVHLINSRTGSRKLLVKKQTFAPVFSPAGKYVLSFDGKDWHSLSVPDGKKVNLTAKRGVSFANELHDSPSNPPPYGVAGWTKNDRHVLLYDRYDVWLLSPDGTARRTSREGWAARR